MKLLPTLLACLAAPSKLLGPLAHLGPLGVAAGALVVPAVGAQEAAPPRGDGLELFERNERTDFDRRSASIAREDFDDLDPGAPGRGVALLTLGAAGAVDARALMLEEAGPSRDPEDRLAAIFALGEMGTRIGPAIDALVDLSSDEDPTLRTAAMVALIRTGTDAGRQRVAEIAFGSDRRAREARELLAFAADPRSADIPTAYRRLYLLRWDAARVYGFVDGEVWAAALLAELTDNEAFLEALTLQLVLDLKIRESKDHLLEALLGGGGVRRIIVSAQQMPIIVETMIESGVWRPADWKEWKWLMLTILHEELAYLFPRTIRMAVAQPATEAPAVALLQAKDGRFGDLVERALTNEDPSVRALTAFALGASGNADYVQRLTEVSTDPVAWVRANAIGALVRLGAPVGVVKAGQILAVPPDQREPRMASYLFQVFERAAPDGDVLEFLQQIAPRVEGTDRAAVDAILLLHSREPVDTKVLRRELPGMAPTAPEAIIGARALSKRPGARDLRVMARLFPREKAVDMNLELASGLARSGHRSVEPMLQRAVWELPWNLSVLAAGVVKATYGQRTLISWAVNPPVDATEEDVRRLGYAIGEWGGMPAVDELRKRMNATSGADLPALQGAILGALASRTR